MPSQVKSTDALMLLSVLRVIRERRILLVLVVGGCLALGASIGLFSERIYRAEVVLMPVKDDPLPSGLGTLGAELGGLASLAGMNFSASTDLKDEALEVLKSRDFTLRFIDRHGIRNELFPELWNSSANAWEDGEAPSDFDVYDRFNDKVRSISERRATGVITVSIDLPHTRDAAVWANTLIADLNEEMRNRERTRSDLSIKYLKTELEKQSVVEVRTAIFRLMETELARAMMAEVRHDFALKIIDPAVASEEDEYVKPNWILVMLAAAAGGLALAVFLIVLVTARQFVRKHW